MTEGRREIAIANRSAMSTPKPGSTLPPYG
jgi:hypothetical protein